MRRMWSVHGAVTSAWIDMNLITYSTIPRITLQEFDEEEEEEEDSGACCGKQAAAAAAAAKPAFCNPHCCCSAFTTSSTDEDSSEEEEEEEEEEGAGPSHANKRSAEEHEAGAGDEAGPSSSRSAKKGRKKGRSGEEEEDEPDIVENASGAGRMWQRRGHSCRWAGRTTPSSHQAGGPGTLLLLRFCCPRSSPSILCPRPLSRPGDEVDPALIIAGGRHARRGRPSGSAAAPRYTAQAQLDSDEDDW